MDLKEQRIREKMVLNLHHLNSQAKDGEIRYLLYFTPFHQKKGILSSSSQSSGPRWVSRTRDRKQVMFQECGVRSLHRDPGWHLCHRNMSWGEAVRTCRASPLPSPLTLRRTGKVASTIHSPLFPAEAIETEQVWGLFLNRRETSLQPGCLSRMQQSCSRESARKQEWNCFSATTPACLTNKQTKMQLNL